jgi:hypothetical protein
VQITLLKCYVHFLNGDTRLYTSLRSKCIYNTNLSFYGGTGIIVKNRFQLEQFLNHHKSAFDQTMPPNLDDLFSLYNSVRREKVVSILEFGCGWSTLVFALALSENFAAYGEVVAKSIRHPNPYKVLTIDTSREFIEIAKGRIPKELQNYVIFVESICEMGLVKGQVAHLYSQVQPWTADFVYLDGPACDHVLGSVHGYTVNFGSSEDRYGLPMAGDILILENFFWPGTHIVVDGRGANSYFLKNNFTRHWNYVYDDQLDQHHFYLAERPWGGISEKLMNFKGTCFEDWMLN